MRRRRRKRKREGEGGEEGDVGEGRRERIVTETIDYSDYKMESD